jgi:hypothetical protein
MNDERPEPSHVLQAIDVYVTDAYDAPPPLAVRSMLATVRDWVGPLYMCPSFVKGEDDSRRPKYSLRLGNRHYPHMKLVIEPAPAGAPGYLFKADSHDRHVCPKPESPEYAPFRALMDENQKLAQRIEDDWAAVGLPTFKTFLRDDLARRQHLAQSQQAPIQ